MLNIYIIYMLNSPQRFEYGIWRKKNILEGGNEARPIPLVTKRHFLKWHIQSDTLWFKVSRTSGSWNSLRVWIFNSTMNRRTMKLFFVTDMLRLYSKLHCQINVKLTMWYLTDDIVNFPGNRLMSKYITVRLFTSGLPVLLWVLLMFWFLSSSFSTQILRFSGWFWGLNHCCTFSKWLYMSIYICDKEKKRHPHFIT